MEETAQRRKFSRLEVELELTWKARRPGEGINRPSHEAKTRDVSSGGLSFVTDDDSLEVGTYLTLVLYGPPGAQQTARLQAVVTWVRRSADGRLIGVRLLTSPEDGLHALMRSAHEYVGLFSCNCRHIRFCGPLAETCDAYASGRNCWQVETVPCCYWTGEDKDCTRCPVSILCFLD